ncbi:hypothetical protein [Streptomyces syringium]|uniref:hypothetical protein n=1 Tax=Streptomyces syringium TaxID=76729 RepID=UPI003453BA97
MRTRPRSATSAVRRSAWAHPYGAGPFNPVFYADGADTDEDAGGGTSESADSAKPDTGTSSETPKPSPPAVDHAAEAEKWKALARKHEEKAKANVTAAKELAELKRQGMSDAERLADEAAAKARVEERTRLAGKLARQGFLAAAAGRIPHAADVADDLNLAKYVAEDGEIDEKGLTALVDRLAPPKPKPSASDTDDGTGQGETKRTTTGRGFDQGARTGGAKGKAAASLAAGRDLWAERKNHTSF